MTLEQKKLDELPEYREFEKMMADCRKGLREQGSEFAARLDLYAGQYAAGQITENELYDSIRGLEHPLRAWITKQSIFRRRRMNKLVDAALNHLTDKLIGAIKTFILPL